MTSPILIVSIAWIAFEVYVARTRKSSGSDKSQEKSSLQIIWITIFVSIFAGVYLRRFEFGTIDSVAGVLHYAGIGLILLGLIVRWIAISKLKHFFTVDVAIREDHRLIREGLYASIRHPAYLGCLISFLGLGLSLLHWLSLLVVFVPILCAFLLRISIEERMLTEEFGDDYRRYAKESSRLIPGIY